MRSYGEGANHRDSIFLERAIVGERIRLAMGLRSPALRGGAFRSVEGVQESAIAEKYLRPSSGKHQSTPATPTHPPLPDHQMPPGLLARYCQNAALRAPST